MTNENKQTQKSTTVWETDTHTAQIDAVQVIRENSTHVWVSTPWGGERKTSIGSVAWTWEDAKQRVIHVQTNAIKIAQERIDKAQAIIEAIPGTAEQAAEEQRVRAEERAREWGIED